MVRRVCPFLLVALLWGSVARGQGRDPMLVGPGFRVAPGVSYRVTPDTGTAFCMDFATGARVGLHQGDWQTVLVPEAGTSWRTPGREHQLTLGLGLGWGQGDSRPPNEARTMFGGVSYVPRLVLDMGPFDRNPGFRHGLLVDHLETTFAFEVSHQVMKVDGDTRHDLRAAVSLDVLLAIVLFSGR